MPICLDHNVSFKLVEALILLKSNETSVMAMSPHLLKTRTRQTTTKGVILIKIRKKNLNEQDLLMRV